MEIEDNIIKLDRELSELDKLVVEFIEIFEKLKIDYVIVSGYISILFGRTRGTEDIDIIMGKINFNEFEEFFNRAKKSFWCLNSDDPKEIYDLLKKENARFAKISDIIPNFELKFPLNIVEETALKDRIEVHLKNYKFYISPIELQIVYKEEHLKSQKDKEDALHIRELFADMIKAEKIEKYKKLIREYL